MANYTAIEPQWRIVSMFPIGDLPDSAAEIAAEQLVAVLIMEWLRICNERVVPFATHSIKLLLVLDPVEHCGLRCQKLGIHRFNSSTSTVYYWSENTIECTLSP